MECKKQPTCSGWSLLELLITLACLGLLMTWASQQYEHHLQRKQRALARVQLLHMALWMERSASMNGAYPLPAHIPNSVLVLPEASYRFSVNSSAEAFTVLATPTGNQTLDACGTLTLNHLGVRSMQQAAASVTPQQCWLR